MCKTFLSGLAGQWTVPSFRGKWWEDILTHAWPSAQSMSSPQRLKPALYSKFTLPNLKTSHQRNQRKSFKTRIWKCSTRLPLCFPRLSVYVKASATFLWHGSSLLFSKKQETESSRWKIAKWGREDSEFSQCWAKPTGNTPSCWAWTGCRDFALILRKSGRRRVADICAKWKRTSSGCLMWCSVWK